VDKSRKKQIKKVIALVLVVAIVGSLAAIPFLLKRNVETDGPVASILNSTVKTDTINSEIIGGGQLYSEDSTDVDILSTVKLTEFLVSNGDVVKAGDAIAKVDRVTVMLAISEVQDTLTNLSKEIKSESSKTTSEKITADAGGTVKAVYAKKGDKVQDVMLEHGALAVLSLDGLMAVKLEVESDLKAGDKVNVSIDGKTVTGYVDSNLLGELIVTVEDDDYEIGAEVTVSTTDGTNVGSGELYIYNAWNVVSYDGTVGSIKISVGDTVKAGKTVINIEDAGKTAYYKQLLNQRQKYEDMMFELFKMYQSETIYAETDGVISGIDEDSAQLLSCTINETNGVMLLSNAPNGDDETTYTNRLCRVTAKGQNGWGLAVNPTDITITDYKTVSSLVIDTESMTEVATFNPYSSEYPAPVYELKDGQWVSVDLNSISIGDVLLFAGDAEYNCIWIVRVQAANDQKTPTDPTKPDDSGDKTNPNTPSVPSGNNGSKGNFTIPDNFSNGNVSSGSYGSFPSSNSNDDKLELYSLDETTLMTITPQEKISLDISVNELDVNSLKVGMEAEIKINAYSTEKYQGVITNIGNTGTNNGGYSYYTVTLEMDKEEDMLSGMNATASIVVATEENAVTVPVEALVEEKNGTVVYTGYDEENETLINPVKVTVGVSDGKIAQITEGLTDGQTIYYEYYDTLVTSNSSSSGASFSFGGNSKRSNFSRPS